jgi:hypothetical protein
LIVQFKITQYIDQIFRHEADKIITILTRVLKPLKKQIKMKKFKLKQLLPAAFFALLFLSCNSKKGAADSGKTADTLSYAYKATYSSDVTSPSHPEYAQKVLKIWKMFESNKIDSMKQYYADTVTYDDGGHRFHGKSNDLLNYARKDIEDLDSLRFDISMWQSVHVNDKNEDWVYIWSTERRYPKKGKADTSLMHEQWKIEKGKVAYFNRYTTKPVGQPKSK